MKREPKCKQRDTGYSREWERFGKWNSALLQDHGEMEAVVGGGPFCASQPVKCLPVIEKFRSSWNVSVSTVTRERTASMEVRTVDGVTDQW
jgi:hypothetical protein